MSLVGTRPPTVDEWDKSVIQYNDENSLSSVLAIAYLSAMQYYFKPIQELPTGRGEEALQTSYFFLSQSIGTIILHLSLN